MKYRVLTMAHEQVRHNRDRLSFESETEVTPPSPLPATSTADLFAEMWRNDPEARDLLQAERLGEMFGNGR